MVTCHRDTRQLSLSVLRYHAKQWSLKTLPVDLGVKPRSIAIVTLKNRTVSPVVQLFIEQIRAVAKTIKRGQRSVFSKRNNADPNGT